MNCPTCEALGFVCFACRPPAPKAPPSVEWTRGEPRCTFCSRTMHRWGMGWVCGCGQAIDQDGELWTT